MHSGQRLGSTLFPHPSQQTGQAEIVVRMRVADVNEIHFIRIGGVLPHLRRRAEAAVEQDVCSGCSYKQRCIWQAVVKCLAATKNGQVQMITSFTGSHFTLRSLK